MLKTQLFTRTFLSGKVENMDKLEGFSLSGLTFNLIAAPSDAFKFLLLISWSLGWWKADGGLGNELLWMIKGKNTVTITFVGIYKTGRMSSFIP